MSFRITRAVRTLLAFAVLSWLATASGCGGSAQSGGGSIAAAVRHVDWGMSLLPGGTGGVGQFPAKFTFDVNAPVTVANCTSDFVVYNNGNALGSSASGPSIVAFNNLYSTQAAGGSPLCGNSGPSVYWSYYTAALPSDEDTAPTSPVLSSDGTKVAFVESVGSSTLVLLQWKAGDGTITAPATPTQLTAGQDWTTCPPNTACMFRLTLSESAAWSSSPYYDYAHDALYVGDVRGALYKFTGVFNGTPALASGWPIVVNADNAALTSPVYDNVSGNVYVADYSGNLWYVRDALSTVGSCLGVPCVGAELHVGGSGGAIIDAPIVDGTNQTVFVVNGTDSLNNGTILQTSTDFTTSVVSFNIGGSAASTATCAPLMGCPIYSGAFDNTYFNSSPGSITGHMYVCGKDHAATESPAMYQLSFNSAGVLTGVGSPLTGLVSADGEACSPVTEFDNPNGAGSGMERDWIFFSVGNNVNTAATANPIPLGSACQIDGAGCLLSMDVTNPLLPPTTIANTAPLPANALGAASGIVVDNVSIAEQASSIYFSLGANSVGTGAGLPSCNTTPGVGCAVKLTQSGLQ